jgi:hypothetical protein
LSRQSHARAEPHCYCTSAGLLDLAQPDRRHRRQVAGAGVVDQLASPTPPIGVTDASDRAAIGDPLAAHCLGYSPAHRGASKCQVRPPVLPSKTGPAGQASRRPGCRRGGVGRGPARGPESRCGRRWRSRQPPGISRCARARRPAGAAAGRRWRRGRIAEQVTHTDDRRRIVWHRCSCKVDCGHGFWRRPGQLLAGERQRSQNEPVLRPLSNDSWHPNNVLRASKWRPAVVRAASPQVIGDQGRGEAVAQPPLRTSVTVEGLCGSTQCGAGHAASGSAR